MRGLLLCLPLLASGCTGAEVARFARVRSVAPAAPAQVGAAATGTRRSCVTVVGLFPITTPPSLGDALAEAGGGAPLADVVVRYELRYLPFVGGRGCYVVEGRPE